MIESDNGFSTYDGTYDEVMCDLSNLVGSLKLHGFTLPDILSAVGVGLTYEWVGVKNPEAKDMLNKIIEGKKNTNTG